MDIEGADLACLVRAHLEEGPGFLRGESAARLRKARNFKQTGLTEFAGIFMRLCNAGFRFMKSTEQ
eukprot:4183815-Pyramimonas_sp.AAC.1